MNNTISEYNLERFRFYASRLSGVTYLDADEQHFSDLKKAVSYGIKCGNSIDLNEFYKWFIPIADVFDETCSWKVMTTLYKKLADIFKNDGTKLIRIYRGLGKAYRMRFKFQKSHKYFKKSLDFCSNIFGDSHAETASCLDEFARACWEIRDLDNSIKHADRALELKLNIYGPDHPETASSMSNLGFVLYLKKDFKPARKMLTDSLQIREKHYGACHIKTASSYHRLSAFFDDGGKDLQSCIKFFNKALEARVKLLGTNHHDIFTAYTNMAIAYVNNEMFDEAAAFFDSAYAIERVIFNEKTALENYYSKMGELYIQKKDHKSSLDFCYKQLGMPSEKSNAEKKKKISLFYRMSFNYSQLGDTAREYEYAMKAMLTSASVNGPYSAKTAIFYRTLAHIFTNAEEYESALQYLKMAIKADTRNAKRSFAGLIEDHESIFNIYIYKLKDYDAALEEAGSILKACVKWRGERSSETAGAHLKMGQVSAFLDDREAAYDKFEKALEIYILAKDHDGCAEIYLSLSAINRYFDGGDRELEYLECAQNISKLKHGLINEKVLNSYANIGKYYHKKNDLNNAEANLETAFQIALKLYKKNDTELVELCETICSVHLSRILQHIAAARPDDAYLAIIKYHALSFRYIGEESSEAAIAMAYFAYWHETMDNYEEAIIFAEKCAEISKKCCFEPGHFLADLFARLFRLYYIKKNYEKCFANMRNFLEIFKKMNESDQKPFIKDKIEAENFSMYLIVT